MTDTSHTKPAHTMGWVLVANASRARSFVRDADNNAMRELCSRHGTLLVFDETHTISTGYGGHTATFGPLPDLFVLGKPVAGGVPCAVFGFTAEVAEWMERARAAGETGHSGIGTTLSANALAISAMHAMLDDVMSPHAYSHMLGLGQMLAGRIEGVIDRHQLPWHVSSVGARVEIVCAPKPPTKVLPSKAFP